MKLICSEAPWWKQVLNWNLHVVHKKYGEKYIFKKKKSSFLILLFKLGQNA